MVLMDKRAIAETLRALASGDTGRSKIARLRDVIDDVESALAAGVTRTAVLKVLAEQGLDMSLATFGTALKRIRQQRRGTAPAAVPPGLSARHGEARKTTEAYTAPGSHHPAVLDEIIGSKPDLEALAKLAKRKKQ
ncbi:MAG: hypothetical protein RIR70_1523 [Pseudomonadota bacterium]